jgi:hypothetical protein
MEINMCCDGKIQVEEQKPKRWHKITIALCSIAILLLGLLVVNFAKVSDAQFASFCGAVSTIALGAMVSNVGEHWKPVVHKLLAKAGLSPEKKQ